MKKIDVKKILDKAIENKDFLDKTKEQYTKMLTGDHGELTDQEKITIEVGFFCNRCKNMEININCSYCLPLKADKINEYLRQIRKTHDLFVREKAYLCDKIEFLEEKLEKGKE
tara:strand:- start:18 stop:356 length:339 start_codon:yes stop_codon:yes gene_type:complete